jgi:branched-chain amino acid transport system permease protein
VILGGLGSLRGTLLGVFLLVGFDNVIAPMLDTFIQNLDFKFDDPQWAAWLTFSNWKLMVFGLALILVMRFRPEGLLPSVHVQRELHAKVHPSPIPEGRE